MINAITTATSQVNTRARPKVSKHCFKCSCFVYYQTLRLAAGYTNLGTQCIDYVHRVQLDLCHLSSADVKWLVRTYWYIYIYICMTRYSHVCLLVRHAALCAWNIGTREWRLRLGTVVPPQYLCFRRVPGKGTVTSSICICRVTKAKNTYLSKPNSSKHKQKTYDTAQHMQRFGVFCFSWCLLAGYLKHR